MTIALPSILLEEGKSTLCHPAQVTVPVHPYDIPHNWSKPSNNFGQNRGVKEFLMAVFFLTVTEAGKTLAVLGLSVDRFLGHLVPLPFHLVYPKASLASSRSCSAQMNSVTLKLVLLSRAVQGERQNEGNTPAVPVTLLGERESFPPPLTVPGGRLGAISTGEYHC